LMRQRKKKRRNNNRLIVMQKARICGLFVLSYQLLSILLLAPT
jgi:hypothetical protein